MQGRTPKEKKEMATTTRIIAENTRTLRAIINGDVESATIGGINISKIDCTDRKFCIEAGALVVTGDEIKVLGSVAHIKISGDVVAAIYLTEE